MPLKLTKTIAEPQDARRMAENKKCHWREFECNNSRYCTVVIVMTKCVLYVHAPSATNAKEVVLKRRTTFSFFSTHPESKPAAAEVISSFTASHDWAVWF
jgi:hypothetical protein